MVYLDTPSFKGRPNNYTNICFLCDHTLPFCHYYLADLEMIGYLVAILVRMRCLHPLISKSVLVTFESSSNQILTSSPYNPHENEGVCPSINAQEYSPEERCCNLEQSFLTPVFSPSIHPSPPLSLASLLAVPFPRSFTGKEQTQHFQMPAYHTTTCGHLPSRKCFCIG